MGWSWEREGAASLWYMTWCYDSCQLVHKPDSNLESIRDMMVAFRAAMALSRAVKVEPPQGTGTRMRAHKELLSDLCLTAKSVIIADECKLQCLSDLRSGLGHKADDILLGIFPTSVSAPPLTRPQRIYRIVVVSHSTSAELPGVKQGTSAAQRCLLRAAREGGERRRGGTCHLLDFPLSVGVIHGGFFMGDGPRPIIPARGKAGILQKLIH
uniref:Uncharacterized protein n=1 Tax=Branchiostoma floridae TaxID=7739 RepID=C3XTU0_BRAFL|eukprot:XP_002612305.1 hypothetical protein BRAFLDRAFT_80080 [Branchiostoma floridae]